MSAWIVYSKDGNTERCRLKRLEYSGAHMGERTVTATFDSNSEVAFDVFDYIEYRGEKFELESIPSVKKTSNHNYEYELRFVSLKYELERCEMRDIVPNDNGIVYPTPLTFSFTGNVKYLAERIQANLDALYGTGVWSIIVAEGVTSEDKNITISQQNCWNALTLVSSTYELDFTVKGRTVTIGGNKPSVNHIFQYGKGNGLYEIERTADTETGIVTKLRAYGSEKNLDYSYPKKPEWSDSALDTSFVLSPLRLMLPSFKKDGKTDYILADEATIAEYGIREASVIYDDIYPTITGAKNLQGQAIDEIKAAEAVDDTKSTFVIHLHDLGFDLESHLTTADAQISMKSGAMQGYTFNISAIEKQNDNSYKITLGRITTDTSDTGNYEIPNSSWNMATGDKFVLLNILMPQEYIREAENRLLERAKEYLSEYGKTNFSYNVGLHDKFLVENSDVYSSLVEGAKLTIHDEVLGISEDVTIQSITITENAEDNILPQVKITLNNNPSASTLDRIQGQIKELSETASGTFSSQSELLKQYRKKLDKPFFDRLFVAVGMDGKELASTDTTSPIAYIKAKYSFATIGGVTMYAQDENTDIPTIAEGLPFDNRTIWFNPNTKRIEVIGGTGGGSGEGVSNFWELSGIPSWITNTKPTYNYTEIKGTPDLSKYATEQWVLDKGYALPSDLSRYIPIAGVTEITGEKNFVGGLKVNGSPIYYDTEKKYWKLEGDLLVTGGVTMYGNDSDFVASTIMDAILYDDTTLGINSQGQLYVKGSVGGATTLGSLTNVGSWADSVASQDRIMYQAANSSQWIAKNLSDLAVGGVTGDYLPLSGGILTGDVIFVSNSESGSKNSIFPSHYYHRFWASNDVYVHFYEDSIMAGTLNSVANLRVASTEGLGFKTLKFSGDGALTWDYNTIWHAGNDGSGSGLDADLLDGYDNNSFFINRNIALNANTINTTLTPGCYHTANYSPISGAYKYGTILNFRGGARQTQFYIPDGAQSYANGGRLFFRDSWNANDSITTAWHEIITSASVGSFNAGSATKLQTPRTIWGQSFDGTGNVSGTLSSVNDIDFASKGNYVVGSFDKNANTVYTNNIHSGKGNNLWLKSTADTYITNSDGTTKFLTILSSGNVGIGTPTPGAKLHIVGDVNIAKPSTLNQASLSFVNTSSDLWQISGRFNKNNSAENDRLNFYYYNGTTWSTIMTLYNNGNMLVSGGITMYSDQRKKTILNHVELSLQQVANAPLIEHYYNSDKNKTTHVGSIAQYWAEMNDWFCKKDNEGFYTMEIQNAALASAISVARELVKFETETDRRIRLLEEENKRLKEEVEKLKWNIA